MPVAVKIEGAGRGKKGKTVPAVNTPAPEKPTGLAGDACCDAGNSRCARPHGVAVGWRVATVCPVGVWCGVLTSHPRPGRTHYGRRRGYRGREQGGIGGSGGRGKDGERSPQ